MTEPQPRQAPPMPPPPLTTGASQRQVTKPLDDSTQLNTPWTNPPTFPTMTIPVAGNRPPVASPPVMLATPVAPQSNTSGITLAQLVKEAFDNSYSDVHLGVGESPRFRYRGEIQMTDYPETDKATFMSWLTEILTNAQIQRFQEELEFDGATQYEFARVRINVFDSFKGYAMVLRLIPINILSIDQLRLPPVFRDLCHVDKGLILVTGPTGSGKSTTIAAMIDYINREMAKHIITIEDPVEFVHQSRKSLVRQREVGMHTRKFDNALKAALREDPDLILVGEIRDKETVNTALKAAQTGHLVMGTLHTNSAVKTIERILNLYSGEEQAAIRVALAEALVCIIAQGLCKTTDAKRAAFHDILINTEAIKEWIKHGKYDEIEDLMKQTSFDGMVTMNQSLFNLYQEGRITEEIALEMSPTPNEMAQFLRGRV
ncbi:type IV pilus twitching motility protein PilT [Anabaena sp. FACHB-1237]|uniref:type IV pilus twitching motility protein PilT n=1 Tax=Anabaena sp. FACHB-1237 TaxID=2692769 RepID=UPI001680E663|nr:type IV pilus twitching motility protein PilT [Anabaena sp. FACHB-1237]MBD2138165.1 type IV pilus twitching motility protein PilT [Anabaena sp. FACHB-1237]